MLSPLFQYTLIRQREADFQREAERDRLAATVSRLRPPLREQLGAVLVRLGTRVAAAEPVQLHPRRTPCVPAP